MEIHLPTINFQGRAVSFREGNIPLPVRSFDVISASLFWVKLTPSIPWEVLFLLLSFPGDGEMDYMLVQPSENHLI